MTLIKHNINYVDAGYVVSMISYKSNFNNILNTRLTEKKIEINTEVSIRW